MATLGSKSTLRDLARMLYEAALARRMWQRDGEAGGNVEPLDKMSTDMESLFDALERERVGYLLVGGVAVFAYVQERNTLDVDLILSVSSLARLPELVVEERTGDFARGHFKSVRVDLLFTKNPLFKLVMDRYATRDRVFGREVNLATAEGLVLLKLFALPSLYRQGKFDRRDVYSTDIVLLVRNHGVKLQPLLEVLRRFVTPGELDDLSKEVAGIEERAKVGQKRS